MSKSTYLLTPDTYIYKMKMKKAKVKKVRVLRTYEHDIEDEHYEKMLCEKKPPLEETHNAFARTLVRLL